MRKGEEDALSRPLMRWKVRIEFNGFFLFKYHLNMQLGIRQN